MKRVLAVIAGIVGGVFLAGLLAPMLMSLVPEGLRAARLLWLVMAAVAAAVVAVFWWASGPRRN
jgi:hypothetical protein